MLDEIESHLDTLVRTSLAPLLVAWRTVTTRGR